MGQRVSCPRCDTPVAAARPVCSRCGFGLVDERVAVRGAAGALRRIPRPPRPKARTVLIAVVLPAAAALAWLALPAVFTSPSRPISGAEAERLLAQRYPRLREAEDTAIACPSRRIEPDGEARCWILLRVGLQRSVVVRLSARGDTVEVDD